MKQHFWKTTLCAAFGLAVSCSALADNGSETRTIDARISKVYLEGTASLELRQGATASLVVSGDSLQINVTGTGSVNVTSHYKQVVIHSTGIGSTNVDDGDSDKIEVHAPGAGHVTLVGQTRELVSKLDGVGGLDARDLKADNVTTTLNGVGNVKVYAKKSANMYLHGVGSVTVYGNPAIRNAEVSGFGKINWE